MVLITSSTYVTPDLMAEFGKIPPAFLPLGNKRLYEYQIPLFKSLGDKIILSLPQSYQVQNAKNLQQENVKIAYVPDNFSLRESIIYCINLNLPLNETLHILHGDTLFERQKTIINGAICLTIINPLLLLQPLSKRTESLSLPDM